MGKPSLQTSIIALFVAPLALLLILGGFILASNMNDTFYLWEEQRINDVMSFTVERLGKVDTPAEEVLNLLNDGKANKLVPESVEALADGADVDLFLFSVSGQPLYRNKNEPLSDIIGWQPHIRELYKSGTPQTEIDAGYSSGQLTIKRRDGDIDMSFESRYLQNLGLIVVVAVNDSRLSDFQSAFLNGLLGTGVALFLLVVVIAMYVVKGLVRGPVDALNDAADKIAHRLPLTSIPIKSRDEFGQLARRMEAMARDLDFYYTELSRERDFNAAILDAAGALMVVLDVEGRIMAFNSACSQLTERKASDVIGAHFWDILVSRSQLALARRSFDGCLNGTEATDFEGTLIRHDGKSFSLAWRFSRIKSEDDGAVSIVASGLDVTQRKRAEEALVLAKESAEQASNAKSEFLANMSHELRTPLNAILGFSETMMLEVFGKIGSDRYKDYIKDIHVSAEHLLGIINDILDLSKIEAGSMELVEENLDLDTLIQSAVDMARSNPHTDVPTIRTSMGKGLPSLSGNQRSMMQILLNILSNAVKFTDGDGFVDVMVTAERGKSLRIVIQDTGKGIPEYELENIFNPFSQVEGAVTAQEGAGLGLTITKSLVEMMGGSIDLVSELGVGTTVILMFPDQRLTWSEAAE